MAANPIIPTGNISGGNGINLTSNLGSLITPEFQGGTLTVDQDNSTYTQNFTLNGSTTNTIDANGRVSTFSGIFRDSSNTAGNIIFRDSSAPNIANVIRLQGRHTYTGSSTIESGNVLLDGGSFFKTSPVTVKPGARLGILSSTKAEAGSTVVGGPGSRSHLDINGTFKINGDLTLLERSRTLFNSGDISDTSLAAGTRSLSVTGVLTHNGENIDSRGGNYSINTGELRGSSNILVDGETLTLTIQNDSSFDGGIGDFNPGQQGGALIKKGNSTLVLTRDQGLANLRQLKIEEGQITLNNGNNGTILQTNIESGASLSLPNSSGELTSNSLDVKSSGILKGNGTITGNVRNEGTVSPGNSIGTLTVDGNYVQGASNPNASLNIEVDGSSSDLLKITGDNRTVLLGGNLNISSYNNAAVSPGKIYTAIDVTGDNATGGELGLKTNLNVVGSSGMTFVRETDREFRLLDPAYYATCTSNDPAVLLGCTKLQFAWLKVDPDTGVAVNPDRHKTPGQSTIKAIKQTGGAITAASSGNSSTNTNTCIANGGTTATCQQQNKQGSGSGAANTNSTNVAKTLDAGWASLSAAVTSGVTGGSAIGTTGYTTNQTSAALVTPDFAKVIAAFFSIPTRIELNQALHSITAEPYASMQSVALEAIEQFGKNSLALTDRSVPLTHTETFCKTDDGTLIPADSPERPDTCEERTKTVGSRWSLLLDGTNTEATLDGTSDLASLDYNVFSTIYGLQYAFSPEWSAGGAFGYGQANLYNYEYANSRIQSDTYGGSLWGIYRPSANWKFSGLLGYMNLQYDSSRQMNFGGLNRTAEANWDGNAFTAALDAQYNWALNGDNSDPDAIRIKPRTFLSYAVHNQGSFSEFGAQSLNLDVDSHTADSLLWGIGFTLETPIKLNSTNRLIPRLTVGYEYDFMGDANEEHQLNASFSELPALGSVDVLGQNRGANALDVGLSIEIETSDSVSLYAGVNGGFWSNGTEVSYGGGVKYSW
ncbi:autotransporter domain-containing protein [Synechococcus sp. RS9909]|uniref:autotransporter family protein n=2 Tax=unclassified Synechococcus TaxID=2626047 RepID=UPI001648F75F|nr:autotransporter domain-containing protein [Synechococcus sp. RS9909]